MGQTYILTYDHIGRILWGDSLYSRNLENEVYLLEKYPDFRIGQDNEAYTYDAFANDHPELLKELKDVHIRFKGRFGIGACTYGQPLSTFINEESNIRQLTYAIRTNLKYFGCTPPIYAMSEHAMHSQLPQLLKGTDYEGAIMRTHFTMYGYNPSYDEAFGWWTGPDGSRIPTVPTYKGEGFAWPGKNFDNVTKDNNALTRYPRETDYSLTDFGEEFKQYQPRLASRFDDAKLRCEELISELEGKHGFKWILLEDLMELFPEPMGVFAPSPNEFVTRMPWGYCGNEIWDGCREGEIAVLTAERLASLEVLLGGSNHEDILDIAWKNLLVAQHHDIQITGRLNDARKFIPASINASEKVKKTAFGFIASKMFSNGLLQLNLFNPLSWARYEWVETDVNLMEGQAQHLELVMNDTSIQYEIVTISRFGDGTINNARIRFKAMMPGLSIISISVKEGDKNKLNETAGIKVNGYTNTISSKHYLVQFGKSGHLIFISDINSGKLLARNGFLTGTIDGQVYEAEGEWILDSNGSVAYARQVGNLGPLPYELQLIFYNDDPRIDGQLKITCDKQQIGAEHFAHDTKVRFKIFPNITGNPTGVRDLPFIISETDNKWIEGNYWTLLTDNDVGLAFFNRGAMGSVREDDGGFSIPFLYSGTYKWGPKYVSGTYSYRFGLLPIQGAWKDADVNRKALEYEFPLVVMTSSAGDGTLGSLFKPFEFMSGNIILSAMYPENGKIIARFYEYKGDSGELVIKSPLSIMPITEINLLGKEQGKVTTPLVFLPWQIRSLQIEKTTRVGLSR